MSKPFSTRIADGIAEMTLDHPPVNAFDSAGWFAIAQEIDELGVNDDVRVIIIGAAGKGFCAGVDIKELAAEPTKIVDVNKGNYETFRAIHRNPKPVIVALHSFVLGGGLLCVRALRWAGTRPGCHGWRRPPAAYVPGAESALHVFHR